MKRQTIFMAVALIFALAICGAVSATETQDIGTDVTNRAGTDLGITNSTSLGDVLLITTAGSASYKGGTTEDSLQGVVDTTSAITPGNGNLVTLNEPNGALEFTYFKKVSSTTLLAKKYTATASGSSYAIAMSNPIFFYDTMTESEFNAAKQQLGNNAFELLGIAFAWKNGAPKDLLKIAGQSGGVSEGLISAYSMSQNFVKNYPLTENDQSYHVLVSPGGGDDNVPMFIMDDTPLKWATSGKTKYYNFYGMSNGYPNDNVYIWWDTGAVSGNLAYWTLNAQNRINFGTVVAGTLSEIQFNNWLLGKLNTDASSLMSIQKLATINKANFDYLWENGTDRTYIMNLAGSTPVWNGYNNVKPVDNYAAMSTTGQNAVTAANNAFTAQGLGTLNANDLVITSAGYSQVNGLTSGALDGVISGIPGLKLENLFSLKRGSQTPLWFVFVKKPTSTNGPLNAVLVDASGNVVPVNYNGADYNVFDISGANLAGDKGTTGYIKSEAVFNAYTYSKPSYAQQDFYIVSLANHWAVGMPYDFLRPACDGGCSGSGLSQGYVISNYVKTALPLGPNEYYIYMGVPAHCKEQVLIHGLGVSPAEGTYFTPGLQSSSSDANAVGIFIRWNSVTNTGTAMLIDYNSTIVNAIQTPNPNNNYYRTMYWGLWYLEKGFPGTEAYNKVLSAYSIRKEIQIAQSDLTAMTAVRANPVSYVLNYVAPVKPVDPTPGPQPCNQGTGKGMVSGISTGIAMASASIAQAANGITEQTAAPAEIAPGLPLGDANPAQTTNTSGIPVVPVASAILIAAILVLVYLGRDSITSAIRGSEKFGK
ncbi:hypothetical protein [Methanobacterium sp. ACI-7]